MRPGLRIAEWGLRWALAGLVGIGSASAVEINEASRAQLEQLNGLGVARTGQILRERARAPFKSWDDLLARVKGIGAKGMQRLGAQGLTVNGQPPPSRSTP
jgi:competence protein ComEA